VTEPLLAEYLSNLDFWRRHFIIVRESEPIRWPPIDNYLTRASTIGFWLDEAWTLVSIVTLLVVESDHIQIAVWFYQKQAETADWSDYFIGVPNYAWVQIWPAENEGLRKVLKDAIAMEILGGQSSANPLRAY